MDTQMRLMLGKKTLLRLIYKIMANFVFFNGRCSISDFPGDYKEGDSFDNIGVNLSHHAGN
jgi:hypothetical protein